MCGISGVLNLIKGIDNQNLERFNSIISHRGPDDEGYVLIDALNDEFLTAGGKDTPEISYETITGYEPKLDLKYIPSNYHVGFGHRRLSILDLSAAGHLPMCDETSNYWITYNGEVYNYIEIRQELKILGYQFKTETDTEVILKSYIHWGNTCLQKFEGMFAIAIYKKDTQKLFLARDQFGIKPLYYWIAPDRSFCFGSEIKQFTTYPGWDAILNKPRAFDYLYYSLTDHTPETLFTGVFQIPPAHYFETEIGNLEFKQFTPLATKKYYDISINTAESSFENATKGFLKLFKKSVNLHLRADVPIGSALSGGLDSSAIVCEINNILKEAGKSDLQKTFSAISSNEKYSEKNWIDEVVNATKVDAYFVNPESEDVFGLTEKILWHMDEPYQSQSAFLGYHVFQEAKNQGVKVLINGQGADEYLSGYDEFRMLRWYFLFRKLKWVKLYQEIKFYKGSNKLQNIKFMANFVRYFFPNSWFEVFAKRSSLYMNIGKLFPPERFFDKFSHPFVNYNKTRKSHYLLAKHQLYCSPLPRFLRWEDRNSMAHGIEARVPFLNQELIEFTLSQPLSYLDELNQPKKLMVNALQNILPKAIFNRKDKKGFITAEEVWVKSDKSGKYESEFKKSVELLRPIVNEEEAMKYFKDIQCGKQPFDFLYWRITLLGMWVKLFNVQIVK